MNKDTKIEGKGKKRKLTRKAGGGGGRVRAIT
jgi:hypothetical protein